MSEELVLLKEYIESSGIKPEEFTMDDLVSLSNELYDAGEFGLARLVGSLKDPKELIEYVGEGE